MLTSFKNHIVFEFVVILFLFGSMGCATMFDQEGLAGISIDYEDGVIIAKVDVGIITGPIGGIGGLINKVPYLEYLLPDELFEDEEETTEEETTEEVIEEE